MSVSLSPTEGLVYTKQKANSKQDPDKEFGTLNNGYHLPATTFFPFCRKGTKVQSSSGFPESVR